MNKYSFKYFSIILRLLCFLHLLNLTVWEYWKHDPSFIFKLPVVNFLGDITPTIHLIIFLAYILSSILFVIKKKNYSYSFTIAVCLMYFELHDKYSFHHDIFLAINIYILFSILSFQYYKRSIDSIIFQYSLFSMKLLLTIVYLFSGIHKINPFDWAKKVQDYGAGEIVVTSVNNEGLKGGFDLKLTKKISEIVSIPTIAHGGAGSFEDIYNVVKSSKISGVGIASLFHYETLHFFPKFKPNTGNVEFLKNVNKKKNKINLIYKLKKYLKSKKINVRYEN